MPFGVLGIVLSLRVLREYLAAGFGGINYIGAILLAGGWVIGYYLADLDHLFYAYACNPQELSCQRVRAEIERRNWRNAWGILQQTAGERTRLPVRNVLTGVIVSVMAVWVVTSSGSLLASGVALGLAVRLWWNFSQTADYNKWYWLFARQFSPGENKIVRWVWLALLLVAVVGLAR